MKNFAIIAASILLSTINNSNAAIIQKLNNLGAKLANVGKVANNMGSSASNLANGMSNAMTNVMKSGMEAKTAFNNTGSSAPSPVSEISNAATSMMRRGMENKTATRSGVKAFGNWQRLTQQGKNNVTQQVRRTQPFTNQLQRVQSSQLQPRTGQPVRAPQQQLRRFSGTPKTQSNGFIAQPRK
ncbi:MAG: hypothetical protein LBB34_01760 [Holosporales bacterium]|nr:hypothetical protein [Holosporales bacterium]